MEGVCGDIQKTFQKGFTGQKKIISSSPSIGKWVAKHMNSSNV
uniref:Bm1188 n=1 Tax=Brugia malayi TaxID=6279 RepID=A0A1I9G0J7_BRUMA|nr:Bm1188 [Brugia malayi]